MSLCAVRKPSYEDPSGTLAQEPAASVEFIQDVSRHTPPQAAGHGVVF